MERVEKTDAPILQLQNITKSFEGVTVLRGINLDVRKGEFITLLGSSGCGKTTTLRIVAGLEEPDDGRVLLHGEDVTNAPPNKRDVNMVFQNYALFPHMNVAQNIGYGLKLRKKTKAEIEKAVQDALALVQLKEYAGRMPAELSGGQRQRIAIARAVVNNPHVLLLDEPLGALDLQLRRQMQLELKRLQKQLGITFLYITHDQEEALNMSDRICVMRNGTFVQIGTPNEIYDAPKTAFVARFVGEANILRGKVKAVHDDGTVCVDVADGTVPARANGIACKEGDAVAMAIRGENISFNQVSCEESGLCATVREKAFAGGQLRIAMELADGTVLTARRHGLDADLAAGSRVHVCWQPQNAVLVEDDQ